MSESIVRKIQPFTIGTKLSALPGTKFSFLAEDYEPDRTLDNFTFERSVDEQVSGSLGHHAPSRCAPEPRDDEETIREYHLNTCDISPAAASRSVRKITICSSNSENNNSNNNNSTGAQLPRIVGVSCENKPHCHFKVLLHKELDDEQSCSSERTNGFMQKEKCSDTTFQMPLFKSKSPKQDLIKGNSPPCHYGEMSKVLPGLKDCCFTQKNALFSREISQAEAWIQEKLKYLRDASNTQRCPFAEWEEVSQTLQRDLKDFENTLIQLNQMGEHLMCKLNPNSDLVRKQLCQLRDQWTMLKHTAASQTKAIGGALSLQEFNKKVNQLETWIKGKEEEQSLSSLLGENVDKLQLTRKILDLKQDEQLHRNLHEEINHLALKLEKQGKVEGKIISTRRKHINKMWLKVQSHLKDCQENLQLALEVSSIYQQADNIICSINNTRRSLPVTNRTGINGDGEIRDIASQIMVLDVTVSQLSNLHPALASRVAQKQAEVKDSWLLLQSTVRNEKAFQSQSVSREDGDLSTSNREPLKSMGTDSHRIIGKEVKEEENRLKGSTSGRNSDNTNRSLDSQPEPPPNLAESLRYMCTSDASARFQTQGKSGTPLKPNNHPLLYTQLQKFTVSAEKTLSWLKDSVTMATHVCSVVGPGSYNIAKRYQASLEQDILSNKARIELVKKEGHSLVCAQHPGSAKIQEFLSQLEVLWEELKRRHQKNTMFLQASEELNYRAIRVLQGLGSLEAWLEAVELSIKQASLAGDPESVCVAERESCLLEKELETRSMELHNLRQEIEALCSQRHLQTKLLPTRLEEVEKKFSNVQLAINQQSSDLKDTRMLTEFLERVELEEIHYETLGQPVKNDHDCEPPLLPLDRSTHNEPLIESLGDPVEELREAVEMLNDTARERGRSQSHDHSIQDLLSRHSSVAVQLEQCLQHCAELAVDVLDMEREMAVRCEPDHCGLDSLQEQQDQLETEYEALKEEVDIMENLSVHLVDLCPERVHALRSEVQTSLQAWEELGRSMTENRSKLLQFGQLRHFFRKYLEVISWTEDTRSRIFSESALRQGHKSQGSMIELLDQQIEQKFQEYDLLAATGKMLLNEDYHLAKMIKERMEELRSMLGWILVHWRAQKDQRLNRKRAEELHADAIYSEATVCSTDSQLEPASFSEDQEGSATAKENEGSVAAPHCGVEDRVQLDNGYEVMKSVNPKSTETLSEECDSPYLLLKEPNTPPFGGTVNLILSFTNSGDSDLQVQEPDHEKGVEYSEAVHRVSTYLHVKDTIQAGAEYENMSLPRLHGVEHSPASFSPRASVSSFTSSPEVDSTSLDLPPRNSASSIFSSLRRKSKKKKKKKDARRHTVQRIMGVELSSSSYLEPEAITYNTHTWPLKEKNKRNDERKCERREAHVLDYVKNPLLKDIDAECLGWLHSPDPNKIVEQSATATTGHVKNHCRFLSLGSVLSFDLPKDMSHIPCIQDIITIGPADSKKTATQENDSYTEHSTALSTFKLARSQPAHKNDEAKHTAPGEIVLKIDCQDNKKIHVDDIPASQSVLSLAPVSAEEMALKQSQLELNRHSVTSTLHEEASHIDQKVTTLACSDHQIPDLLTSIDERPEQNEASVKVSNDFQAVEDHVCPSVHTLIQDLHGHQYHKAKPTCSKPRKETPAATQKHSSHVVLNFKASGREDSVDSGHSSSGSFKLCTETPYLDLCECPGPRRTVEKLLSLETEKSNLNLECLKTEPAKSPVDDPVHPDHQQFEQEEEELEDIWNQTNAYRQSICSDIMYQGPEPTSSFPDQQRGPSSKEQPVLIRKMITASAPNLLVAEFRLPSSVHNLMDYVRDWSPNEDAPILSNEERSWETFTLQKQSSNEPVLVNETAADIVKLPEIKDPQKYIYQYKEEEEEEGDEGGMKNHPMSVSSAHMDLDGVAMEPAAHIPGSNTRVQTVTNPMSVTQNFPSMEGTLERKHRQLLGGRKALCRSWSSCHVVLYRQTLCFYQDRKDTMKSSVTSLPLNLIGAECIPVPDYTKKPNCFSLRLRDGSEYLLSASKLFMMKKWIRSIQANADYCKTGANTVKSMEPTTHSTYCRRSSPFSGCQCSALCQCSMNVEGDLIHSSYSQSVNSARTKEIILPRDDMDMFQHHHENSEELSPNVSADANSHGGLLKQRFSQNPGGLHSLFPSQDCNNIKRRSQSFTSATYQRIKPCTVPPTCSRQNSNSSYSVTLFIGNREKPSVCSRTALLQPNSCRQQSFSELPLRGYTSLPRPHNKSVFKKIFGKKE
ncbi:uncharacterized protein [Hoplias malabaricus]|uniref:uncharacterized protein isoform X2 n=1 Tax=Hoplias malabaricus TaxID=27720 RepID=UPI003462CAAD